MNWLTLEQVKKEAIAPRMALEISIRAWWQKATATKQELTAVIGKFEEEDDIVSSEMCGLCQFFSCSDCPLARPISCYDANSIYQVANRAFHKWLADKTPANFQEWQQAARAMHKKLCSLRKAKNE